MALDPKISDSMKSVSIRRPGLRPLQWPPWRQSLDGERASLWSLGGAFVFSIILSILLSYFLIAFGHDQVAVAGLVIRINPAWILGLLWTCWFGWPYGVALLATHWLFIISMQGLDVRSASLSFDLAGAFFFYLFLRAYPVDPSVRSLKDVGLFVLAAFLASMGASVGAISLGASGMLPQGEALQYWGAWWRGNLLESIFFVGPILVIFGAWVSRWKAGHFQRASSEASASVQVIAAAVAGLVVILFFSTWNLSNTASVDFDIKTMVLEPDLQKKLLASQRLAAISQGALVATLLGLVTTGIVLAFILRRRMEEQILHERLTAERSGRTLSERMIAPDLFERLLGPFLSPLEESRAWVLEYDVQDGELTVRGSTESNDPLLGHAFSLQAPSPLTRAFNVDHQLMFAKKNSGESGEQAWMASFGMESAVAIPLGPQRARSGLLWVGSSSADAFDQEALDRLKQAGIVAAAALEKIRVFDESQTRADDLVMLNEVSRILMETPALDESLSRIADLVKRQMQVAGAAFFLPDGSGRAMRVRGAAGFLTSRLSGLEISLAGRDIVVRSFAKNELCVEVIAENRLSDDHVKEFGRELHAVAAVPMQANKGPVGVMVVYEHQVRVFKKRALQRLRSVARLAASAVERGVLGQALKATEAQLQEILDGIPALVIGMDPKFKILSFNAMAESVTGWRRDEALGKDFLGTLIRQERERRLMREFLSKAMEAGGHGETTVGTVTSRNGQPRRIRWTTEALRGHEGAPQGLVAMGLDYTEQIKLEAQLLQAQKMESVGALAGGMAHDFNNLLAGILGQAALARSRVPEYNPIQKIIGKIEGAAQRGTDLTGKLLAFARRSVLQPQRVDLTALLEETVGLLQGSLPREIKVLLNVASDLPPVHGDATQLQQVLLNLCVNARDAMPAGGTLHLTARSDARNGVLLEVIDDGIGMTEEVKAQLFEPFFTTKEPGKGTGLGLSVVFGIVRSHGGQLDVESEPGKGTRFILFLPTGPAVVRAPAAKRPDVIASASALNSAVPFGGTEEILLIDDERILRETNQELLDRLGYEVTAAADGGEALNLLDQKKVDPSVIILDVMMPGLSGVPLLWELQRRLPDVPVILISGYSSENAVHELLDAGALELIAKPFRLEDLAAAIRRALELNSDKEIG